MGRLNCGRDAMSDRLGVVEEAVSPALVGLVSYPCRIILGGRGSCPIRVA